MRLVRGSRVLLFFSVSSFRFSIDTNNKTLGTIAHMPYATDSAVSLSSSGNGHDSAGLRYGLAQAQSDHDHPPSTATATASADHSTPVPVPLMVSTHNRITHAHAPPLLVSSASHGLNPLGMCSPPVGSHVSNMYESAASGGHSWEALTASLAQAQSEAHALRVENTMLRQRVAVLTTSPCPGGGGGAGGSYGNGDAMQHVDDAPFPVRDDTVSPLSDKPVHQSLHAAPFQPAEAEEEGLVPVPLLRAHVRRLQAALQLESMEREALERRVLAQEGVLLSLQLEKQQYASSRASSKATSHSRSR